MFRTFVWLCAFGAATLAGANTAHAQTLTLRGAMENALAAAPELRGAEARIEAARAARLQAGTRPNPTLGVEVENFLATGSMQGFADTEVTATYSQLIERGGKREARSELASRVIEVSQLTRDIAALDLIKRVEDAWYAALAAEARVGAAEERVSVAQALAAEVTRRVAAARDPVFARTRAEAEIAAAEVARSSAIRAHDDALAMLVMLWGGTPDGIALPREDFLSGGEAPLTGEVMMPDLRLGDAEVARAGAAIEIERSRGVVDPTLHGGVRYLAGADAAALVAGVSVPLPLYNTNEGAIQRAVAERTAVMEEAEAARLARLREIAALERALHTAEYRAAGIRDEVIPLAERAAAEVLDGFRRGGFVFRDVQDADAALIAARLSLIDAISETHILRAELNRVSGRHVSLISEEVR
jgi:cobalt-zinc-cadmium efflux system outer membrane protein